MRASGRVVTGGRTQHSYVGSELVALTPHCRRQHQCNSILEFWYQRPILFPSLRLACHLPLCHRISRCDVQSQQPYVLLWILASFHLGPLLMLVRYLFIIMIRYRYSAIFASRGSITVIWFGLLPTIGRWQTNYVDLITCELPCIGLSTK